MLHLCAGGAGNRGDDVLSLACETLEGIKVVAEDFESHVAARARDGLVHAHLHGL